MKIETRFDVGQEVAYLDREPHRCAKCGQTMPGISYIVREGKIWGITCGVEAGHADDTIWYQMLRHLIRHLVPESNVFGTRAEAEAEAARRNEEDD